MYESARKIERQCIFREAFLSEAEVRKNRGVPLGITFSKGRGIWTGANDQLITYPSSFANFRKTDVFSVRVKMKLSSTQSGSIAVLYKLLSNLGWGVAVISTGYLRFYANSEYKNSTVGTISFNNTFCDIVIVYNDAGTYKVKFYVNGVYDTESTAITAMSQTNNPLLVCDDITGFDDYTGEIEFIEIYNYALNVNEVDRLYNKRRFKNFNIAHSENLSAKLNVSACINSGANPYDTFTAVGLDGFDVISDGTGLARVGTADEIPIIAGKTYRVTFDDTINSGNNFAGCFFTSAFGSSSLSNSVVPIVGSNTMYLLVIASTTAILCFYHSDTSAGNVSVRNLVVKQVAQLSTSKILDVSGQSGSILDKLGNTLTLTSMTVNKEGQVRGMLFNGSTSKVDCGVPNNLTGDKTILLWFKAFGTGEMSGGAGGFLIDNGKLIAFLLISTMKIGVTSNGSTIKFSLAGSFKYKKFHFVAIIRLSNGLTTIYIDGVANGTTFETSGIPAAGTTNLIIGNNTGQTRTFNGLINDVRIVDGLLTSEEISQLYTSEKTQYGR
jgi:hypothetical protein